MCNIKKLNITILIFAVLFCSGYYMSGGGYLNRIGEQRMLLTIAPPPPDSIEQIRDRQVFIKTRSELNSARWKQAIIDTGATKDEVLKSFSCAAGRDLSTKSIPNFTKLVAKTTNDTGKLANLSKKQFKQPRPFKLYSGSICKPSSGYDYPSGHAMVGWTIARLLAEYYPERRTQLFAHARNIAESRVICGAHSVSAVEVVEDYSRKIINRLKLLPSFQNDLNAAKPEMDKLDVSTATDDVKGNFCEKFPLQYVKPFSSSVALSM